MSFGPESANPRQRRARAHALRDHALASGKPGDKLRALEAANAASDTNKGKDPAGASLGQQTLSAFFRQMCQDYSPPESVSKATASSVGVGRQTEVGVDAEEIRILQAVDQALGHNTGITAAVEEGVGIARIDFSVPGTQYAYYAAVAAIGMGTAASLRNQ